MKQCGALQFLERTTPAGLPVAIAMQPVRRDRRGDWIPADIDFRDVVLAQADLSEADRIAGP
ncbi:MAG: hypothetical protein NT090_02240, partial [Acidobacteria bacterium]|nr:hypothetical protein [Acidobacteriota bacterium]